MKVALFLLGWFFFALGIVGAFLPILPTTPFLLLAALLFSKSSPRFHKWLLELPVFGDGVRDWQSSKVIRPKAKVLCSLMMLTSLTLILKSGSIMLPIKYSVCLILMSVWIFVISRKSA